MGKLRSHKNKGGYASYRSAGRLETHKRNKAERQARLLERRKAWRIKKYGKMPQAQLSSTTIKLFNQWNVPLIGAKKGKK